MAISLTDENNSCFHCRCGLRTLKVPWTCFLRISWPQSSNTKCSYFSHVSNMHDTWCISTRSSLWQSMRHNLSIIFSIYTSCQQKLFYNYWQEQPQKQLPSLLHCVLMLMSTCFLMDPALLLLFGVCIYHPSTSDSIN